MPDAPRITLETTSQPAEEQVVLDGVRAFNVKVIGDPRITPVNVFARDESGRVIGGVVGWIKWRWLYVSKLWLPDSLRGTGTGTKLMQIAEEHAWKEGCLGAHLDTFDIRHCRCFTGAGLLSCSGRQRIPARVPQYHLKKNRPDQLL